MVKDSNLAFGQQIFVAADKGSELLPGDVVGSDHVHHARYLQRFAEVNASVSEKLEMIIEMI